MDCDKCRGRGYYYTTLKDRSGKHDCRQRGSLGVSAAVPCDMPACRNGKVTPESMDEYYRNVCGLED